MQNIFFQGNKHKFIEFNKSNKLEHFYECTATLMTENLQTLGLNSLLDYKNLICNSQVSY